MPISLTNMSDPADIVALARRLWGEPNRSLSRRDELRFGANGSKSVRPQLGVWFDHEAGEGGYTRHLYRRVHGAYPENGADKPGFTIPDRYRPLGRPVDWWDYHDEQGLVVARVVRFEPPGARKTFMQCRPDGAGWRWKLDGLQVPLYRLPSLLRAPAGSLVYLCEGEKHADRLREWGLVASTNPGGAGKFRADHARALAGRTVIVLGDNDMAGRAHVAKVVRELHEAGVTAHVLVLPGLPEKGDVLDWIAAGGTREELSRLTDAAMHTQDQDAEDAARLRELGPVVN